MSHVVVNQTILLLKKMNLFSKNVMIAKKLVPNTKVCKVTYQTLPFSVIRVIISDPETMVLNSV